MPLVFAGAHLGGRAEPLAYPTKTNLIPRSIPPQAWYMQPAFAVLVGGVLPFGAVFIELFFILSSVWLHQYYYVFGFLLIVFLILLVTCCEVPRAISAAPALPRRRARKTLPHPRLQITIVLCYFQLCAEDYRWWWRSFLTAGSSGLYLFAYSGAPCHKIHPPPSSRAPRPARGGHREHSKRRQLCI